MKVKLVPTIIAVAISALIAYALYSIYKGEHQILLTVGGSISFVATLIFTMGIKFDLPRTTMNVKAASGTFFGLLLISHIIFSLIKFTQAPYIIINGILLLAFILTVYSISQAKQ